MSDVRYNFGGDDPGQLEPDVLEIQRDRELPADEETEEDEEEVTE